MTWVQTTRTHIKSWAWGLTHVTPAETDESRGLWSSQPIDKLQAHESSCLKKARWDAEEDLTLASGRITSVPGHKQGRSEGIKSQKLILNRLSYKVYNTKKLETDDFLLFFWILGQSETAGFSESRKASTKQLFHTSDLHHSTPSVMAFASNNPVQYSSVSTIFILCL